MAVTELLAEFSSKVSTKKNSVGVFVEKNKLFCAHVSYSHKKIAINALSTIDLKELGQSHVKPLDMLKNELSENLFKKALIVSGFPTLKTLTRTIEIQSIKQKELNSAILYQIEPHLPYPLSECVFEKVLQGTKNKRNQYLVVASQKSDVKEHIDELNALSIDPEIVAPKSEGLIQFAHVFIQEPSPYVLIDICPEETTCILFYESKPLAIRSLPLSLEINLQTSLQNTNDETSQLKSLAREIARVLMAFQNIAQDGMQKEQFPLIFTGPVEQDPLILSLLAKLLGHEAYFAKKPPKNIFLPDDITLSDCFAYAAPLGLALLQSPLQKQNFFINFRKNEFLHPKPWQRFKKEFGLYFAAMALISAALFLLSENHLKSKKVPLCEKYLQIVALLEKSPEAIEKEFLKTEAPANILEKISRLSTKELAERLSYLEQKYAKPSQEIALFANVPRVLDLLAWLQDRIENQIQTLAKTKTPAETAIKLENFHYALVKRPEKGKPTEKYQVRVDLEFTASSPDVAKEIQTILKTPNQFVNPNLEIRWQAQKNRYSASFFLRDFTQYPQRSKE